VSLDFSAQTPWNDRIQAVLKEASQVQETQVVYRNALRWVPRLKPMALPEPATPSTRLNQHKSYVITGGLGGLGLSLCRHLINLGAGTVHLISRRMPDVGLQQALSQWCTPNAQIKTHQLDICDQPSLDRLLDSIQGSEHPIAGLFHLAGIDDRAAFLDYDWEKFQKVMAAKIKGAWYLHQYSLALELDYFVLYSSIAASVGSARQAPYVVANTFLDALSELRRLSRLPAQSINWGPWSDAGMANNEFKLINQEQEHLLSSQKALRILTALMATNSNQTTVVDPSFLQFLIRFFKEDVPAYLSSIALEETTKEIETPLVLSLKNAMPSQYAELIETFLVSGLSQITQWDKAKVIDPEQSFFDMGIDSLMAVELAEFYRKELSPLISLSPTLLFDASNIKELTEYLVTAVMASIEPTSPGSEAEPSDDTYSEDDIKNMSFEEIDAIIAGTLS
jgi:NADP-dependent 3-hydroxy acid dehydrogenase YdfG/acyl carrier protein